MDEKSVPASEHLKLSDRDYDRMLLKYMRNIARGNRWDKVLLRGVILGVGTAVGTTLGLAVVVVFLVQALFGLRSIPFVDSFLAQTKLDLLIEDQLARINREVVTPPDGTTDPDASARQKSFTDVLYHFGFVYPDTFTTLTQTALSENSKVIRLTGAGSLQTLDIYVNQTIPIEGESVQRFIAKENLDRVIVNIYETGARVGQTDYSNTVFSADVSYAGNHFQFIGVADADRPKIAREVFISIIESAKFNSGTDTN